MANGGAALTNATNAAIVEARKRGRPLIIMLTNHAVKTMYTQKIQHQEEWRGLFITWFNTGELVAIVVPVHWVPSAEVITLLKSKKIVREVCQALLLRSSERYHCCEQAEDFSFAGCARGPTQGYVSLHASSTISTNRRADTILLTACLTHLAAGAFHQARLFRRPVHPTHATHHCLRCRVVHQAVGSSTSRRRPRRWSLDNIHSRVHNTFEWV